jgi:hypothetical protein
MINLFSSLQSRTGEKCWRCCLLNGSGSVGSICFWASRIH